MSLLSFNWLKSPADREIIRRWTPAGPDHPFEIDLPQPPDPERFQFLALGDTGDSDPSGSLSPQDAVAEQLARDAVAPVGSGDSRLVLHLGDVVYMTGERRLYERNFRRPYEAFLTPDSTLENLVFRVPFLPVPGNHDYYDFARWARWMMRTPVLGSGVRAAARELFTYRVPEGGSGGGKTFMDAFVDRSPLDGTPLPYQPGKRTRIPNRYYQFRYGCADFFALDSNTLDPPPPSADPVRIRREAARRVKALEERARVLDRELKRDQIALERLMARRRATVAHSEEDRRRLRVLAHSVHEALLRLDTELHRIAAATHPAEVAEVGSTGQVWARCQRALERAASGEEAEPLLERMAVHVPELEHAGEAAEKVAADLPEGPDRRSLDAARTQLSAALKAWEDALHGALPPDLCHRIRSVSESVLDTQRELARERRREDYRPEDFDSAQLQWLDAALRRSEAERPDAWRIVFLHHPLYTTTGNHCEHPDVQGVRDNLLSVLRGRVHLVLTGHSHAFEWIRSRSLPETGIFVTGGGGQVSLRRSILAPERFPRYKGRYESLRQAGALESAHAGRGPDGEDGATGPLYHYLRIEVTPKVLSVHPVGVRRLRRSQYRREEPMPVFHVPDLTPSLDGTPFREVRSLEAVEIRRGRAPRAVWA